MAENTSQQNTPESPWFDTKAAATYLHLSPASLRTFRSVGRGPRYHKAGAAVRYHRDQLDAWIRGETSSGISKPLLAMQLNGYAGKTQPTP